MHHLICIIQYCIPVSLKHSMFTCSVGATYSSLCVVSSDNIYFWPLGGRSKLIVNVQKVVSVDQYFFLLHLQLKCCILIVNELSYNVCLVLNDLFTSLLEF